MKEMTWKSRLNRLFAHRFALPVLCWCAALVFWLVQGAVAFAGDSSAKAKGIGVLYGKEKLLQEQNSSASGGSGNFHRNLGW